MSDMEKNSFLIIVMGSIYTLIFLGIWTIENWGVWTISTMESILFGFILMLFGMVLKLASRER